MSQCTAVLVSFLSFTVSRKLCRASLESEYLIRNTSEGKGERDVSMDKTVLNHARY